MVPVSNRNYDEVTHMRDYRSILILTFISFFILSASGYSAERWWVFFTDKGANEQLSFGKQRGLVKKMLSDHALKRRALRGNPALNEKILQQDLPLEKSYVARVEQMGFKIHAHSRWFNAVSGYASPEILEQIKALPFVASVGPVLSRTIKKQKYEKLLPQTLNKIVPQGAASFSYGFSQFQINFMKINVLQDQGLYGDSSVVVAMFDTGFRLTNPALRHIPSQLIAQYDFVQGDSITANQPGDAYDQDEHGTLTLSTLGGYLPDTLIGPAFGSSFLLFKTEKVDQEIHREEDNWAMAAEWADSLGADIVSSSLGYSVFDPGQGNYTYADMNGNTTIVTKAANYLTDRGIIVVNSAGNEGPAIGSVTAPGDGFQVLTVGAVNNKDMVASFSSRGPTYDGRIKPDVCGLGVSVFGGLPGNNFASASGTSLSCPLVAGIVAQILQKYPKLTVTQVLQVMRGSGNNSQTPDNDRGWGTVNAEAALSLAQKTASHVSPENFSVLPPQPNPYIIGNGYVYFPVDLIKAGDIKVEIFNVLGQKITEISVYGSDLERNMIQWDGRNQAGNLVAAGVYIYRIQAASREKSGKFIILN